MTDIARHLLDFFSFNFYLKSLPFRPLSPPVSRDTKKRVRNITKRILAIPAAIPPNPKTAASIAMI